MSVEMLDKLRAHAPAAALSGAERPAAQIVRKPDPYVQFEGFVLQSFIQSILPKDATEVFGEGTAGEVWKSMLAEKIAAEVAESGGIGIARMIAPKGGEAASLPGTLPGAGRDAMAAKMMDWQLGSAPGLAQVLSGSGRGDVD